MKEITIKVEGMSCEGCEKRIQNALKEIEEITDVKASHTKKEVKITIKEETNLNDIKETITDLGFNVIE